MFFRRKWANLCISHVRQRWLSQLLINEEVDDAAEGQARKAVHPLDHHWNFWQE